MTHIRAWGVLWTLFLLTRGVSASAATVCVDTKPKAGCYPTITAGIAAAQSGDTINVAHGTYREQVIIRKSGLSLIGDNAANTIIDAGSSNTPNGNGVGIYVDGMTAGSVYSAFRQETRVISFAHPECSAPVSMIGSSLIELSG